MFKNRDMRAMYSVAAIRPGEYAWWAAPSWFQALVGQHAVGVAASEGLALAAAREVAGPSSRRVVDFLAAYAHWQGREGLVQVQG